MALKVRGVTYDSPAELADSIDELEQMRDDEVDELRARGADAAADQKADQYAVELNARRATLREANEKAAAATEQPPNRPKGNPGRRRSSRPPGGGGQRRSSSGGRSIEREGDRVLRELARPARRDVGRFTSKTGISPYTGGAADMAWWTVGVIVGLTVVYALVQGRGPGAVEAIVTGGTRAFGRFMDPGDAFLLPRRDAAGPSTSGAPAGQVTPVRTGDLRLDPGYGGTLLDSFVRRFGLFVTDVDTPGEHTEGSFHYQKDAAGRPRARDVKPNGAFYRLAAWARTHPSIFREFYGPMGWHIEDGALRQGAYPDHDDHGHIAI